MHYVGEHACIGCTNESLKRAGSGHAFEATRNFQCQECRAHFNSRLLRDDVSPETPRGSLFGPSFCLSCARDKGVCAVCQKMASANLLYLGDLLCQRCRGSAPRWFEQQVHRSASACKQCTRPFITALHSVASHSSHCVLCANCAQASKQCAVCRGDMMQLTLLNVSGTTQSRPAAVAAKAAAPKAAAAAVQAAVPVRPPAVDRGLCARCAASASIASTLCASDAPCTTCGRPFRTDVRSTGANGYVWRPVRCVECASRTRMCATCPSRLPEPSTAELTSTARMRECVRPLSCIGDPAAGSGTAGASSFFSSFRFC